MKNKVYFLLGESGGMKLNVEDQSITVITPDSPLGRSLIGKSEGDFIEIVVKKSKREYEITRVA